MQRAGITQHETAIGFYENAPQRVEAMPAWKLLAMKSAAVKAMQNLIGKLARRPAETPQDAASDRALPPLEADPEALAEATTRNYSEVARLVQALADQYGFQAYFFWQPSLFAKRHRSAVEQSFVDECGGSCDEMHQLFTRVYDGIRRHPPRVRHFTDLQAAFDDEKANRYIDLFHLTEKGNARIADRIAHTIAASAKRRSLSSQN